MNIHKMDTYMLNIAKLSAQQSKATKLKVGAVFSRDGRPLSTGWNGILEGIQEDHCEQKGKTRPEVIHAEMNALRYMAREGISTRDSTLYITHSPCIHCAKHLAGIGLKRIVYELDYKDNSGVLFLKEHTSIKIERKENEG